ncbi:MAG: hypothetical protein HS132_14805 [Planctomycetia bacterium]|nr:hypothetical protein [Planctomycetia bacterium]
MQPNIVNIDRSLSISEVKLPLKNRDELPPILRALQHIYVTPELNEEVFRILEEKVQKGKKKTGRYGMELWHILALSVVRLGLDANYDRLEDFANHHRLIRQIPGVETTFGEGKVFPMQGIKDNISLLDEEAIRQINELLVSSGHQLVKKKDEGLCMKMDTYVLETHVHFPTDMNLLWDAGRKSLDMIEDAIEEGMTMATEEKIHSLFEPLTEWLYKGKSNKRVELGHTILVASDQWGFIVDYVVGEKQADVSFSIPLADRLLNRYGEGVIESISFDKGFYKKENKELLSLYIPWVIMTKKGKKDKVVQDVSYAKG